MRHLRIKFASRLVFPGRQVVILGHQLFDKMLAYSRGDLTMRVGVYYFPTDYGIDVRELARAVEERGFESLLFPEHTHIPKSRRTPFPGGGELPRNYSHTHDPFVALSFAAAATKRILLGTGICLIPQ